MDGIGGDGLEVSDCHRAQEKTLSLSQYQRLLKKPQFPLPETFGFIIIFLLKFKFTLSLTLSV